MVHGNFYLRMCFNFGVKQWAGDYVERHNGGADRIFDTTTVSRVKIEDEVKLSAVSDDHRQYGSIVVELLFGIFSLGRQRHVPMADCPIVEFVRRRLFVAKVYLFEYDVATFCESYNFSWGKPRKRCGGKTSFKNRNLIEGVGK